MDSRKKINVVVLIVVLVVAVIAIVLLYGNQPTLPVQENGVTGGNGTVADKNIPLAEGEFEVKVSVDGFTPQAFRMKKLQQLVITIVNEEEDFHNTFKFEDALLPFEAIIPNGGTQSFTIVAPEKTGEYTFFTDVGIVRYGILVVE